MPRLEDIIEVLSKLVDELLVEGGGGFHVADTQSPGVDVKQLLFRAKDLLEKRS